MSGIAEENIAEHARRLIEPVLVRDGYELVEVEWTRAGGRWTLRLYIDRAGGVDIDDCQAVSRTVEPLLDVEDFIEPTYDLEVSSPGLDRQLRKDRELAWALGKPIRCWLAGGQEFRGTLAEVGTDRLVLDRDGERLELPRDAVTKARLDADVPWPRQA